MKDNHLINTIDASMFQADGERTIEILIKDKATGDIIGSKVIKRALLAKYMQPLTDHHVTALDNQFVVEY